LIAESGYGILVPINNVQAVVDAVYQILNSKKYVDSKDQNIQKDIAKKYSLEAMISSIETIYLNEAKSLQ
jgi:glycosyltransferase involved in cell wall biosynthesis